jgi:putative phage-type endonuclease
MTEAIQKTYKSREDWLQARRAGLGGSDAPAILCVSPYRSPMTVYCDKLGISPQEQTPWQKWGHRLESVVAEAYAEETGRKLIDHGQWTITVHGVIPFLFATLDRVVEHPDKGPGPLQIKTAAFAHGEDWKEEAPVDAQVQLQHEMEVMGATWGSLAVLIGGRELRWTDYDRNPDFVRAMLTQEQEFWARVQHQDPPPADHLEATSEALKWLYPKDTGETKLLPPEAAEWVADLEEAKRELKSWGAKEVAAGNVLRAAIGDATFGLLPDGTKYQWKWQQKKSYTVAPSETRVLRRLK